MDLPFKMEQVYNTPIEKVWQALTDQDAMKIWYFPQLKRFEPSVGFNMEFDDDGSSFKKQWQVTQVLSGKKLAHSWTYHGYPGASEVIF
ncbi:SRPBCC domain-containing protein [Mucilaginibacter sp. PAMB04168]|uniref:SRPBCC family protein n=1 Tax=Mucilaginibacter sp. PAMB04168 TaxID=3138567 RepID=UPI0031F71C05